VYALAESPKQSGSCLAGIERRQGKKGAPLCQIICIRRFRKTTRYGSAPKRFRDYKNFKVQSWPAAVIHPCSRIVGWPEFGDLKAPPMPNVRINQAIGPAPRPRNGCCPGAVVVRNSMIRRPVTCTIPVFGFGKENVYSVGLDHILCSFAGRLHVALSGSGRN